MLACCARISFASALLAARALSLLPAAIIHKMFVIKIFTNDWFSQPLGLYSVSTKDNRVGELFIIVIIKQNVIFLAKACNFAQ